jgi:DNA-binding NarL/FixJ family response regulator
VVVVDDHPLFVEALTAVLGAEGFEVVGVAVRHDEVLDLVAETRPDAVLLDLTMPGGDGYTCLQELRTQHPGTAVLVVSGADAPVAASKVLKLGAAGFVGKALSAPELGHALRIMLRGQPVYYALPEDTSAPEEAARDYERDRGGLTRREREILQLVAEGLSNPAIGRKLRVTEQTVKFHVSNIFKKLDASNRTEAALRARQLRLLTET